jgi:ECF sigma factor
MDAPSVSQQRVTELLTCWSEGNDGALAELTPLVYEELRRLAHHHMVEAAGGRPGAGGRVIEFGARECR